MDNTFDKFLQEHLTKGTYDSLPELLSESRRMTTILIRMPDKLSARHVGVLSELLVEKDPIYNSQYIIDHFITKTAIA